MKRVVSACLEQTNRFENESDYNLFLSGLERKKIKFKVVDVQTQPDNSVIVKIKKQYNDYDTGDYLTENKQVKHSFFCA